MTGAFATVAKPKEAGKIPALRIKPETTIEGQGEGAVVVIRYRVSDIAKSRPQGEKGTVGFMPEPAEFTIDGAAFALKAGFTSLVAR
jgi:hypothetical protein